MKPASGLFLLIALFSIPAAMGDPSTELIAKAEAGDIAAQMELATQYATGEGAAKNMPESLKWLSKAAEQGNSEAQMKLGGIYIGGRGVKKSSSEAAKWFMMSAMAGNPAAQVQIARMHMTGGGVLKDDVEAYKWANLAGTQGDPAAKKIIVFLEQKMSSVQIADGQTRSREFLEMKEVEKTLTLPDGIPVLPTEPAPPVEPE